MPKIKFDKETILEKALHIAKQKGFHAISVRGVAKEVGCSTAPIYTAYGNVEKLIEETKNRSVDMLLEFVERNYTNNKFLNVGVGTLVYAIEYPRLYKELFIDNFDHDYESKLRERNLELMSHNEIANIMDEKELEIVLTKMWLLTHGIAAKICSGAISVKNEIECIEMLEEVGGEIITAMIVKSGKFKGDITMLIEEGKSNESTGFGWNIWN